MRFLILVGLVILPASGSLLRAQVRVDSGVRVRVTSSDLPKGRMVGPLERVTNDSVVVAGQAIARPSISRFEAIAGRRSALRPGLGIGVGGGALAGAVVGAILCSTPNDGEDDHDSAASCALELGGLGGAAGLVVGGVIGAFTHRNRWRTATLKTLQIAPLLRSSGAFGIFLRLGF